MKFSGKNLIGKFALLFAKSGIGHGQKALRFRDKSGIFMPPTSKKLRGHIGLGLSVQSVCQSAVSLSVCDA